MKSGSTCSLRACGWMYGVRQDILAGFNPCTVLGSYVLLERVCPWERFGLVSRPLGCTIHELGLRLCVFVNMLSLVVLCVVGASLCDPVAMAIC